MSKLYEIGGYSQLVKKGNINCTCMWGSLYPNNFKEGKQICRHLKMLIKNVKINSIRQKNTHKTSKAHLRDMPQKKKNATNT